MEENNNNNNKSNNSDQSPQTAIIMNKTNNNDLIINTQTNLTHTIDIHLPVADRTQTESKLSFNSSRVDNKSIHQQQQQQQQQTPLFSKQQIKRAISNVKKISRIEFPLVKQSKTMPIIKENISTTDVLTVLSDSKSMNKKKSKTAPILLNKDMKSAPSYFSGYPISNGYLAMKVNPTFINEFSYLNRNKIVNRRLSLRKQGGGGLKAISVLPEEFENNKTAGEFALGNPNSFNKSDQELTARSNVTINHNSNNNNKEIEQIRSVITPDSLKLLDNTIKIDSDMIMKAAANSFENLIALSDVNTEEKPQRLIKSSSIVILEKNNSASNLKNEDPSPVSYHIPRRPPNQKNSPMYTIGRRCFNEKSGGGRTSWEKEWFNSSNPFTIKSDFKRDQTYPSPNNYNLKSTIGADSNSSLYYQYPTVKIHNNTPLSGRASHLNNPTSSEGVCSCHMILSRQDLIEMELRKSNTFITTSNTNMNNNNNNNNNSNNNINEKKDYLDLNIEHSAKFVSTRAPKVKFQFRNNGTQLWPQVEKTPGPGQYDHNKFSSIAKNRPKFTVAQARLNLNSNYNVGPFAAL